MSLKKLIGLSGLCAVLVLINTGCISLFPSESAVAKARWTVFKEVQADYDKIIPHKTTMAELKTLGFDPYTTPNIRILAYTEVLQRFLPNASVSKEDLPEPVRLALEAKEKCQAYELDVASLKTRRYGNLALDVFNFRRQTRTTGWSYRALIVIKDDLVVYKLWSGEPMVNRTTDKKRPLGPFQEIEIKVGISRFF